MAGFPAEDSIFADAFADTPAAVDSADQVEATEVDEDEINLDADLETPATTSEEDPAAANDAEDESSDDDDKTDEEEAANDVEPIAVDEDALIRLPDGTTMTVREGLLRQKDYTRKTQELADARKELEAIEQQHGEALEAYQALEAGWDSDPVDVIAHLITQTENPTRAVVQAIQRLAVADELDQQFLNYLQVTPEVKASWVRQREEDEVKRENAQLRQQLSQSEAVEQEVRQTAMIQAALEKYERQFEEIVATHGLTFANDDAVAEFKSTVAAYAQDNQIRDLRKAYAAMAYEQELVAREKAKKAAERAKSKAAKSAATTLRGSASSAAPLSAPPDDFGALFAEALRGQNGS